MNALSARRPVLALAADVRWLSLAETGLRVLLVAAAPICAVIFVVQSV